MFQIISSNHFPGPAEQRAGLASADLLTGYTVYRLSAEEKKDKPMRARLGTERHGIKKIRILKAKNGKKERKISVNFC